MITTGRLTIAPVPSIAACGGTRIGVSKSAPWLPMLVMVKVPPASSSGLRPFERARAAMSAMARARPASERSSALWITGDSSPFSVSTAIPRCTLS
ncbi:Uncharacterised protein [Mycobacteroides abscessus subsp. abscessus]|nr:Uncharacterised protein [Mycobacteroides abscessus subsp. abscessus]